MNSRGITLFNDLLPETALPTKDSIGNGKMLTKRRNELMLDRLFYLKKIFTFDYNAVLEILSYEFFLTDITIPQIIQKEENQSYLRNLKAKPLNRNDLEKKWPHMVWNEKILLSIYGVRMVKIA